MKRRRRHPVVTRIRSLVGTQPEPVEPSDDWARRVLDARAKVREMTESQRRLPAEFRGWMALADLPSSAIDVKIDLDADRIEVSSDRGPVGSWDLDEITVTGRDDGFHLLVEGEELRLVTNDDPGFALAVGLRTASPAMRRRIAASLHEADEELSS